MVITSLQSRLLVALLEREIPDNYTGSTPFLGFLHPFPAVTSPYTAYIAPPYTKLEMLAMRAISLLLPL